MDNDFVPSILTAIFLLNSVFSCNRQRSRVHAGGRHFKHMF